MATEEQEALISNFMSITSSSHEEALFFLESHNFQLDSALHSFFENSTNQHLEPEEEQFASAAVPAPQPSIPYAVPSEAEKGNKSGKKKKTGTGRIRTLADLSNGSESDSEDEDRPQEYFTGGEKSGMLVQDPGRGRGHNIDALFDEARQMGAEEGPFEHQPSSSSRSFTGTGRLLSGETIAAAPQQPPENVVYNIYFWNNGFTINDGPLRRFDDPANASFLESIRKSECPKELEPASRKTEVNVNLIRKPENYNEPVKRAATFQGTGRTLGSGSSANPAPAVSHSPVPSVPVVVDDSKPTTSIQLRLADGSRTVGRFNTYHTVGDIRSFIDNHSASSGRIVAANYTLQTVGFPPKQLTDTSQTIEQAGLSNSVVIQKL